VDFQTKWKTLHLSNTSRVAHQSISWPDPTHQVCDLTPAGQA